MKATRCTMTLAGRTAIAAGLLAVLAGCRGETSSGPSEGREAEHAGHVIPAHRPRTYPDAVHRLRELNDQMVLAMRGGQPARAAGAATLPVAMDIAGWLPEIAAESDMPDGPWNEVNRRSTELVTDYRKALPHPDDAAHDPTVAMHEAGQVIAQLETAARGRRLALVRRGQARYAALIASPDHRPTRGASDVGSHFLGSGTPRLPGVHAGRPDDPGGPVRGGHPPPPARPRGDAPALRCGHPARAAAGLAGRDAAARLLAGRDPDRPRDAAGADLRRRDPGVRHDGAAVQPAVDALRPDALRPVRDPGVRALHHGRRHGRRRDLEPAIPRYGVRRAAAAPRGRRRPANASRSWSSRRARPSDRHWAISWSAWPGWPCSRSPCRRARSRPRWSTRIPTPRWRWPASRSPPMPRRWWRCRNSARCSSMPTRSGRPSCCSRSARASTWV